MFGCLLLVSMTGCSQRTELKQEIAAANDLLPQPITLGLTAQSVALDGDAVVFSLLYDEDYFNDVDLNNPDHLAALQLILSIGMEDNAELARRMADAGCHIEYELVMSRCGDTLRIRP